jgi:hypothetical protein
MSRLLAQAATDASTRGSKGAGVDPAGDMLPRIDRIIIYIDDLDRCPPRRVVEMLEAVHLLLAVDLFVVVVAVDPRWLLSAITAHYRDVLAAPNPPVDPPSVSDVVDPDDETLWQSTATQYLEKIFQVVLTLPPLDAPGYQRMLRGLVGTRTDQPAAPTAAASVNAADDSTRKNGAASTPRDDGVCANDGSHLPAPSRPAEADRIFGVRLPAARVVERVDPFALDPEEIRLLDLLGPPHLITTPRQVKRLANSYGLFTALRHEQRPNDLAEHTGRLDRGGESRDVVYRPYRSGMVLLAVLVAYPALGPGLFVYLSHAAARHPYQSWTAFLSALKPRRADRGGWCNRDGVPLSGVQAQQWLALTDALRHIGAAAHNEQLPLPEPLHAWSRSLVPVGRLSFPTGRVVSTVNRAQPLAAEESGSAESESWAADETHMA